MAELTVSIISLVVAVIAIGVSVWAHLRTNRQNERLVELEEAREEDRLKRQASAKLRADFADSDKDRIKISNVGESEARNVRIEIGNTVFLGSHDHDNKANLDILGPGTNQTLPILRSTTTLPPFKIVIDWDDDVDTARTFRTTLR